MGRMSQLEKAFVNSRRHDERVARRAAALLAHATPRPGQRYLDVGCGTGAAAVRVAREYALAVTGIDVDPAQIRAAHDRGAGLPNLRFLTADARRLPAEDAEFDIVATHQATHHIPGWEQAVVEMLRVLGPTGHFVYGDLTVPEWLAAVGRPVVGRRAALPTVAGLERILHAHGLTPVHVRRGVLHYESVWRRSGERPRR